MLKVNRIVLLWILIFAGVLSWRFFSYEKAPEYSNWATYAGTKDGIRYSSNNEITIANVSKLQPAWIYDTGDSAVKTQIQCNPIVVNDILYGTTPQMHLFALNASTGKEIWNFTPLHTDARGTIRGVTYWQNNLGSRRIYYSVGPYLYAVHADDGLTVKTFGEGGFIDLRNGLDGDFKNAYVSGNAPGIICDDMIITSMRVSEGDGAAPGHIRAFDVYSGKRKWIFHTIPRPGEVGYDSWKDKDAWKRVGGANNWTGMSLDEKRKIVYVSTGSATPDFYGAQRKGANLFANSVIALNALTGKYIWHYQVIHHDIWDRDLPANPNLITVKHQGKLIDAVAQITKHGYIFLLDRVTGKPLFPLKNLNKKYNEKQVKHILENGRNMMPSFKYISETERTAIINYLLDLKDKEATTDLVKVSDSNRDIIPKYIMTGYHRFYDKDGYPGIKPPWGTLNAVSLNTGKLLWKVPLGEFEELTKKGIPPTGTEGYGGPVVTKGGLVFIASTMDEKIRAFNKVNGNVLWEAKLPAAGFATPAVYMVKGRQYVVIACGGGKIGKPSGSKYLAFTLPDSQ